MYDKLISVIVPIYNVEKYLCQCIDSIRYQTYRNLEIILVDDGSPDSCGKICDEYEKKDNRIKVIHKKNGGLSSARNAGITVATGEYIGMVDSDDFLLPSMYERLLELIEKNDCSIAVCRTIDVNSRNVPSVNNEGKLYNIYRGSELLNEIYARKPQYNPAPCNKLYRRNLFNTIHFPDGKIHEDEWILPRLLLNSKKIVITEEIFYCYYLSPNSIMRGEFKEKKFDVFYVFEDRMQFFKKHKMEDLYLQTQAQYYLRICMLYYELMNAEIENKEKWKRLLIEKISELKSSDNKYMDRKWKKKSEMYINHPYVIKIDRTLRKKAKQILGKI